MDHVTFQWYMNVHANGTRTMEFKGWDEVLTHHKNVIII